MSITNTMALGLLDDGTSLEQRLQVLSAVIQHLPIPIALWHLEHPDDITSLRLVLTNHSALGPGATVDLRTQIGRRMTEIFPGESHELLDRYAAIMRAGQPTLIGEMPFGRPEVGGDLIVRIMAIPIMERYLCVLLEDITDHKRAEEALRQLIVQEETIRSQEAVLAELSTPLIPISDRVMVMPLIGAVDSRRAQQVLETLLDGIASRNAQVAILDITGVPVVDTQVANALIRASQAVKLLGARMVLTGIRPEVAQTLVGLGAELSEVITHSSLQNGIAYANRAGG